MMQRGIGGCHVDKLDDTTKTRKELAAQTLQSRLAFAK